MRKYEQTLPLPALFPTNTRQLQRANPTLHCVPSTWRSHPPSPAGFLAILPGSPLHRCMSCALPPARRQKTTNARTSPTRAETASALAVGEDVDTIVEPSTEVPPRARAGRGLMAREAFVAACVGSLLDFDHFLAAGSIRLSQATGLSSRPWCHSVMALFVAVRHTRLSGGSGGCLTRKAAAYRTVVT